MQHPAGHGGYIGIPFYEITVVCSEYCPFGKIKAIQYIRLVVNQAFGRIDILGYLFVRLQRPPAKTEHPARKIMDGK